MENGLLAYLICYFGILAYFTVLGVYMVLRARYDARGVRCSGWNMRWAVAVYMLAWVLQILIYLPAIFSDGYNNSLTFYYNICFLVNSTISMIATIMVMRMLVQQERKTSHWLPGVALMGVVLTLTYVFSREIGVLYAVYAVVACAMLQLFLVHLSDYKRYIFRLKSEYSDISGRDISWSWYVYFGFVIQIALFLVHEAWFNMVLEYAYMLMSAINATVLVYYTLRLRPIGNSISDEQMQQIERVATGEEDSPISDDLAAEIKHKLETYCEAKQLYLQQGLTREMLCREIGVNRTYLSIYLRQQGTTYYQYINTLRIRYAVQLRQHQPNLTISELASLSGFKTLPTFRKAWQEIYGPLYR